MSNQKEADMTIAEIRERVAQIAALKEDDESAHAAEDKLHTDVLRAIAEERCLQPAACAAEALKTADIAFGRWHA